MKKTYIAPVLDVEIVDMSEMIAVSNPKVGLDSTKSVDAESLDVKGEAWDIWSED